MKKFLIPLALVLLLSTGLFLAACGQKEDAEELFKESDTMTLVVKGDFERELKLDGLKKDVTLTELLELNDIEFRITNGMLYKVGKLEPEPPEYIYVYTSVESDFDVTEYATEMTYNEVRLVSAGVGAEKLKIEAGAVIYIGSTRWER